MTAAVSRLACCGDDLAAGPRERGLTYAHLDHAASTPPLVRVLEAVAEASAAYASVHRGAGLKSRRTTARFDEARAAIGRALGMDDAAQVLLFTRNTTEGLNHLARRLPMPEGHIVVVTAMEHHSNDLPWRRAGRVVRVGVNAAGRVDETELRDVLVTHAGRVVALAATAASNVTGIVNPVHRWARWVHEAGGRIVVDAAQLVPHRRLDCRPAGDAEHLDVVAFSGHKLYAPFGAGGLIAPRALLGTGDPAEVGGGTIAVVGDDYVEWAALPDREEAGTPPVLGALALAAAFEALDALGWDVVLAHEMESIALLHQHLRGVPGLALYADAAPDERVGTFAFNLDGLPHGQLAAVLDHEWAIGTRSGCFCAHPYVKRLLGLSPAAIGEFESRILVGDRRRQPGMVRASVGLASSREDALRLLTALQAVARGEHGRYVEDATGTWMPVEA